MIRWMTSGESHGQALTAIIEGLPSNLKIDTEEINRYLAYRQSGYGRGARQKIETAMDPYHALMQPQDKKEEKEVVETNQDVIDELPYLLQQLKEGQL